MIDKIFQWVANLHGDGKTTEEICKEWHCFWIGWAEMMCLRIPPILPEMENVFTELEMDWHYYTMGRACGVLSWIIIIKAVFL